MSDSSARRELRVRVVARSIYKPGCTPALFFRLCFHFIFSFFETFSPSFNPISARKYAHHDGAASCKSG